MSTYENARKFHQRRGLAKKFLTASTVFITFSIVYVKYGVDLNQLAAIESFDALKELTYYIQTQKNQCAQVQTSPELYWKSRSQLNEYFKKPQCNNILENMTRGNWVTASSYDPDLKRELDKLHSEFRKKVGIPTEPWRDDGKCGYDVLAPKLSWNWPQTGTFCNPNGQTPCCTDRYKGSCVAITPSRKCECPTCVDTSKYKDALLSEWRTTDEKCNWVKYEPIEACAVLNKLSSNNTGAHLYFVGDSLMRNMFMGLTSILVNEPTRGIYKHCVSKELQELCHGENLFIQRPCHDISVAMSLEDLRGGPNKICNGNRYFKAEYTGFGMPQQAEDFIKFVKSLNGIENTMIIMGFGLHFHCKHEEVITKYLDPVLSFNSKWPKFIWVHINSIGLLKPPAFMKTQGNEAIDSYSDYMEKYLTQHNIPILDVRHITKGVDSYDGTHYGSGVNMMKVQILLNYIATLY